MQAERDRPDFRCFEKTRIFLIGSMGSGKTETGKALHRLTGLPLVDMDEVICREQGRSISDLFEQSGEQAFRKLETQLLKRLCTLSPCIVACGGGVAERSENTELLRTEGRTFFLQGSPALLFSRVKNDYNRPNIRADIADEGRRFQYFCKLCQQRDAGYRKASSHFISIEGKTPDDIAGEILNRLSDSFLECPLNGRSPGITGIIR